MVFTTLYERGDFLQYLGLLPSQLAKKAYALYEKFWPEIPPGKKGWGASGKLDLDLIRKITSA